MAEKLRSHAFELNVSEIGAVLSGRPSLRHFASYEPEEGVRAAKRNASARSLAQLAALDEAYRPSKSLEPYAAVSPACRDMEHPGESSTSPRAPRNDSIVLTSR
jgi:hypothetical protein